MSANEEKLRSWLIELIMYFREEMKKLSIEEQKAVSKSVNDLSEPCQLLVIWAKEPEFQINIITHLNNFKDMLIEIYGPVENSKLIQYIENEVLKSSIIQAIGRELVEDFLANALGDLRYHYNSLMDPLKPCICTKARIRDDPSTAGWVIIGNLQGYDAKKVASNCIESIVSIARERSTPPREEKVILQGFGTYIYPPIWIGEIPKRTFKEKVIATSFRVYEGRIVLTETYKNRPLIVMKDGYIAIGESDKQKAQEFLNEIMSILLLRGIPANAVREVDLGTAVFTETSQSFGWSPLSSRALLYERLSDYFVSIRRISINEENMRKAIKLAELLTSDNRMKTLLSLFLEAYTYFQNTEYKQSLIIGWVILEDFYIKDLWTSQVSKVTSDKHRLSKLESWKVDARLEALNISGVLTNEEFALLMEIKDSRNEAVHKGKTPSKEICEKCLKYISKAVQEHVGRYVAMKFSEL
jgi:uncharacterized protein YutE (UPF0331/DUF86 family)